MGPETDVRLELLPVILNLKLVYSSKDLPRCIDKTNVYNFLLFYLLFKSTVKLMSFHLH